MEKKMLDYEVVEVCPHCDEENVYPANMIEEGNYIAVCQDCGRKIFLCDECLNADDNEGQDCDWHKEGNCSVCMRGRIEEDDTKGVVQCLQCGKYFQLTKTYEDNLGKFTVCPFCEGSFDID